MKIVTTSDALLEIRSIKNITSIKYIDIFLPASTGKKQLVPGFITTYGPSNKTIILISSDPYFEEYVKTIKRIYLEEKDDVIEDALFGKKYIEIDKVTKEILLHDGLDPIGEMYSGYRSESSYKESLLMEEDRLQALFPLISFHLKESLKKLDKTLTKIKLSDGINGVYYLNTMLDGTPVTIPVLFDEKEDSFTVTFGNLLSNSIPIKMEGVFAKSGISVHVYIEEYAYSDYTSYSIQYDKVIKEREISHKGALAHYEKDFVPSCTEERAARIYELDSDPSGISWYKLPWNAYIGLFEEKWYLKEDGTRTTEEQRERIVQNRMIYLSHNKKTFYLKEFASKRYHKKLDDRTDGGNVLLDSMNKRRIGLSSKDCSIVETHFTEGITGNYKDSLQGNYYYQVYSRELKKENGRFIDKEDGLEEKSDLFNPKMYIKREDA